MEWKREKYKGKATLTDRSGLTKRKRQGRERQRGKASKN
jgi:hypothetical protein